MEQKKIGFLQAIFRYFRYRDWKKARGIILTAEEQFTASTDGISAAFDIQYKKMTAQMAELKDAIAKVENGLAIKRTRLIDLEKEKENLLLEREDALTKAEVARNANDHQTYESHAQTYERLHLRCSEIEQILPRLQEEILTTSQALDKFKLELQKFQARIDLLPQQKEEAIADFIVAGQAVKTKDDLI